MAFPAALLDRLASKLEAEVFDAGSSFMIELIEDHAATGPWAKRRVVATMDLPAGGDCWLVDHAWAFDPRDARAQLEAHPPLLLRLASMLGIDVGADSEIYVRTLPLPTFASIIFEPTRANFYRPMCL